MPPTYGFNAASFGVSAATWAFLCPTSWNGCSPKTDAFAVASGSIIGQRQALEDRLDACTTLEEVQGITVNISMPGGGKA